MRKTATFRSLVPTAAHRRSLTGAFLLALALASAGRLNAADEPPVGAEELARLTVVSARLMGQAKAIESLGCYGFAKSGHCLLGASIAPQESVTIRIPLEAGREHFWFAAADVNAKDLDIQVTGPSGSTVAKDVSNDPVPCVVFTAKESGEHRVTLTLFKGTSTSFCALVMMERDGWAIPFGNLRAAMEQFVLAAGSTLMFVDQMSSGQLAVRLPEGGSGWCLFGVVMKQNESRAVEDLSLGKGLRVFLAAGCSQATDIDLEITDQNRKTVIANDKQTDANPMGLAPTDAASLYRVTTSLPSSRGAALVLTGVLTVAPANAARNLIQAAVSRR